MKAVHTVHMSTMSTVRSTLRNAPTKPPDRLYRQTQSIAAGFADRRPC